MRRAGGVALLLTLAATPAAAFSVSEVNNHTIKWSSTSLSYYLDSAGAQGRTPLGTAVFPAVRASVATWNAVTCNAATLTESGVSTGVKPSLFNGNKTDGKNVIGWVTSPDWNLGLKTLAVTNNIYSTIDGHTVDADIAVNGTVSWSVADTTPAGAYDVQSVITHELGHFLGLQHVLTDPTPTDPPTMWPYILSENRTRTLTQDDMDGVCFLYPATPYVCSTLDDCPYILDRVSTGDAYVGRMACTSSRCQGYVSYDGSLGNLCNPDNATDCRTGLTCTVYSGTGYCAQPCGTCPDGYQCTAVSASASVCLADQVVNPCACDATPNRCDSGCSCDRDCSSGGCADAPPPESQKPAFALLIAAFVYIYARAKRRRHGGARFARR